MKNTQRHDSVLVRKPPTTRPTAPPPAAIALHTPSALVLSRPSANVVVTIERAAGETRAAPRPWRARPPINTLEVVAKPFSSEAPVKTTTPATKSSCRPNRSAARPPSSRNPPNTSV